MTCQQRRRRQRHSSEHHFLSPVFIYLLLLLLFHIYQTANTGSTTYLLAAQSDIDNVFANDLCGILTSKCVILASDFDVDFRWSFQLDDRQFTARFARVTASRTTTCDTQALETRVSITQRSELMNVRIETVDEKCRQHASSCFRNTVAAQRTLNVAHATRAKGVCQTSR
jgi:hypothetical protein